jgi:enoyl-CoA hydratase/carnithine racemase
MGAIEYAVEDGVAFVELNRPEVLNALDGAAKRELGRIWVEVAADESVRCVVLAGRGRAFCAGSDVAEIERNGPVDTATVLGALPNVVREVPQPIVAAVHGHTLGMGLNLALHCDIRIAHAESQLGFPEVRRGMISAAGAVALPAVVGLGRGLEMLLLGAPITGTDAAAIGLVTRLADDPRADAATLARQIAQFDPRAVAAILRLARLGSAPPTERLIAELEEARNSLGA